MSSNASLGLPLLAFKVQSLQFDLNRELSNVSMRDQVVRARTLVLNAHAAGLLSPDTSVQASLLIIGGGVGGITAALTACELGLSAVVVETAAECFPLLALGSDRLFSATLYDWPSPHFRDHSFPFIPNLRHGATIHHARLNSIQLRFPNKAATAAELRAMFLAQLQGYRQQFADKLKIYNGWRLADFGDVMVNPRVGRVGMKIREDATGLELNIAGKIAIFAFGFGIGNEGIQAPAVRDFFSYANLEADVQEAAEIGVVEISGAGDGGLQEALRFILKPAFHDLEKTISALEKAFESKGYKSDWEGVCAVIAATEAQAGAARMWGYSEDSIFAEVHEKYLEIIKTLLVDHLDIIEVWTKNVSRTIPLEVRIYDPSIFSRRVYALNRFLILLLELSAAGFASGEKISIAKRVNKPLEKDCLKIARYGLGSVNPPAGLGTADAEDLLRRTAFRAIPGALDTVR